METNKTTLNLQNTAQEMVKLLGSDLKDYQFGSAELCSIFCTQTREYVPAVVVTAQMGEDVKYLVYSPLSAQMLVTEDKPKPKTAVGDVYVNGCLSAYVVEQDGKEELTLYYHEEDEICTSAEKALSKMIGWLAVTYDGKAREAFYQMPSEERVPKPVVAMGFLGWSIPLEAKDSWQTMLFASVGRSKVNSMGMEKIYIREVKNVGRYNTIETSKPTRNFFWNGQSFRE